MNEDFLNQMSQAMQEYIERMYDVTTEVSTEGNLYERYRLRGHPLEIIRKDEQVFELNLN